ncbi:MAG: universal stress protein [Evtepia sp.]|uniref:universal stress protein n=1 Tax=Evtepia sp. TaxID=2773933 RepID=UPI002A754DB7|nr:universal stress protein [Evtepia sp.]MDY3015422.1 universal stress protein [Evtepia sp.]
MKKVLLPIDGSARSLRTIEMAKQLYAPGDVELTILIVLAGQMHIDGHFEVERLQRKAYQELDTFAQLLQGYEVKTVLLRGSAGPEIVHYAESHHFDVLMMTRSSRGPLQKLGSVATYIVRNAPFLNLLIMHETKE